MHRIARGALFIMLSSLTGVCAGLLMFLFPHATPETLALMVLPAFGGLSLVAAWTIRGPWWFRVPATLVATVGAWIVAIVCSFITIALVLAPRL